MIKIWNAKKDQAAINTFLKRSQFSFDDINQTVETIIHNVKENQDEALKYYSKTFDKVDLETFKVTQAEIDDAFDSIDEQLLRAFKKAVKNITAYHEKQGYQPFEIKKDNGVILGQKVTPIDRVGLYVPGGSASYPSTVFMNAIPASIAGVKNIVMTTPPQPDGSIKPAILVAARLAGVDEIYKLGGAHAIAALSFGTKQIKKVDKIVGPGNIYVSMAKKMLFGYIGIDMIAGPSEILIIADEAAEPDFIAADMMGQAEHDSLASAILITPSSALAKAVKISLNTMIASMDRKDIITSALKDYGAIIVVEDLKEAIALSNQIAPEHLEIMTKNPLAWLDKISHAGSIFLGAYTPEPLGDYLSGPNHTLPTSGTAKFSSPLSTTDFQKTSAYSYYPKAALDEDSEDVINFANNEGLSAHANAIKLRRKSGDKNGS